MGEGMLTLHYTMDKKMSEYERMALFEPPVKIEQAEMFGGKP